MEFTKSDIRITKGVAILFMLLLHLFCRKDVDGVYQVFITIKGTPLIYYLALFADACVPMYCFASGYGLYLSLPESKKAATKKNISRIIKLLINYWIILIIFVAIGFLAGVRDVYPGSLSRFLSNFFVLSSSYNGAWWFLQTYIILVFLAPFIFRLIKKYNSFILLGFSGAVYLLSYIQRFKQVLDFSDSRALSILVNALVLVGTSQLSFMVGAVFAKERLYSAFSVRINKWKYKNLICFTGIAVLVIIHSLYESMIIAPATGITFICLFNLIDKSQIVKSTLNYLGNHSTNIWLTHMFFYLTIFPELVFAPKSPVLIFSWLVILCLASSHVINFIYKPVIRIVNNKTAIKHSGRKVLST